MHVPSPAFGEFGFPRHLPSRQRGTMKVSLEINKEKVQKCAPSIFSFSTDIFSARTSFVKEADFFPRIISFSVSDATLSDKLFSLFLKVAASTSVI
jgi:hypothetical protein